MVQDRGAAAAAVQRLKDDDAGRAALLLAGAPAGSSPPLADARRPAGRAARFPARRPLGRGPGHGRRTGRGRGCRWPHLLAGIAVVEDLDAAAQLIAGAARSSPP